MNSRISIQGMGTVGAFGCGIDAYESALESFSQGVCPKPASVEGMPVFLADDEPLKEFMPPRQLRRIDHFSRLALLGAFLALKDAGRLDAERIEAGRIEANRERMGVVVATGYGATATTFKFLDSLIDDGDVCASPTAFSSSVHNAAAAYLSMVLKAQGPSLTVSQFGVSVHSALLTAMVWLEEGRTESVLFGAVDQYCDVLGYCWRRFFGRPNPGGAKPLEFDRQTAIPGEGAAFFLLTKGEGRGPGYGFIASATMGNAKLSDWADRADPALPDSDAVILAADGHSACGPQYAEYAKAHNKLCLSPLYGSAPMGAAFDMAAAALAVKRKTIWNLGQNKNNLKQKPLEICCLKLEQAGGFGLVRING